MLRPRRRWPLIVAAFLTPIQLVMLLQTRGRIVDAGFIDTLGGLAQVIPDAVASLVVQPLVGVAWLVLGATGAESVSRLTEPVFWTVALSVLPGCGVLMAYGSRASVALGAVITAVLAVPLVFFAMVHVFLMYALIVEHVPRSVLVAASVLLVVGLVALVVVARRRVAQRGAV